MPGAPSWWDMLLDELLDEVPSNFKLPLFVSFDRLRAACPDHQRP